MNIWLQGGALGTLVVEDRRGTVHLALWPEPRVVYASGPLRNGSVTPFVREAVEVALALHRNRPSMEVDAEGRQRIIDPQRFYEESLPWADRRASAVRLWLASLEPAVQDALTRVPPGRRWEWLCEAWSPSSAMR